MQTAANELGVSPDERYLSLETFRKSGVGIRTPVWFAAGPGGTPFYVYTTADAGKAKRVRNTPAVRIAACDMRGGITGPWFDAMAERVTGAEFDAAMRLLDRKYFPWKQLLNLSAMLFRRRERVVIAIRKKSA